MGIIDSLYLSPKFSDEPFFYRYRFRSARQGNGGGADFSDESAAMWKCIGEVFERHLWRFHPFYEKTLRQASYRELRTGQALDIFSLAGFSSKQQEQFACLQFDNNSVFGWTKGRKIHDGQTILIPAQLTSRLYAQKYARHPAHEGGIEPMLRWTITTGLATGQTLEEAIVKGTLEVLERDAFMVTYLNHISPTLLDASSIEDAELQKIFSRFRRYKLRVVIAELENILGIPTHMVLLLDEEGRGNQPYCTIGASTNFDTKQSILSALSEALFVRYSIKNESVHGDALTRKIDPKQMGLEDRIRYYARKENFSKIAFLTEGPTKKVCIEQNIYAHTQKRSDRYKRELVFLKQLLTAHKIEGAYVELSTSPFEHLGLCSVFAILPSLQPLHPAEHIPYFSGHRINKSKLYVEPHPFP
jgi:ribosomal protein S12 methylthiotransferase accessory factor